MLFDELFNDFFNDFNMFTQAVPVQEVQKCPTCGRTYSDFRRSGRFGCPDCYSAFRPSVTAVIKQVHSNSEHTGKIPSKSGGEIKKRRELESLKNQLQNAVKSEDYETAAKLHKQIREMENGGRQ